MSRDPIGFAAGDVNLSRYVGNSPASAMDPAGLAWYSDYFHFLVHNPPHRVDRGDKFLVVGKGVGWGMAGTGVGGLAGVGVGAVAGTGVVAIGGGSTTANIVGGLTGGAVGGGLGRAIGEVGGGRIGRTIGSIGGGLAGGFGGAQAAAKARRAVRALQAAEETATCPFMTTEQQAAKVAADLARAEGKHTYWIWRGQNAVTRQEVGQAIRESARWEREMKRLENNLAVLLAALGR